MVLRPSTTRDDSHPWTTSRASAARTRTARSTAGATPATSRSATATASTSRSGCSTATPARPASPSARARRCSTRCLPEEKALSVLEHLAEGSGVRQTDRLVGVHRDTVVRLARAGRRARPGRPRRARGFFPPRPVRSSSTRSGRSSPRSRSTATPPTRPMTTRGTGGTMWPSTPSTGWSWPSSPGARSIENAEEVVAGGPGPHGGAHRRADDQRRVPGLRDGDRSGLRRAEPPRPPGTPGRRPVVPQRQAPAGLNYATVHKEREKGRVVVIVTAGGVRDLAGGGRRPWAVAGEPDDQHLVRGAAERHRPAPQRAEGAEDLPVQQGLAGARGDDLLHDVQLQLLLAGADAAASETRTGAGGSGRRRWRPAWRIMSGRSRNG